MLQNTIGNCALEKLLHAAEWNPGPLQKSVHDLPLLGLEIAIPICASGHYPHSHYLH